MLTRINTFHEIREVKNVAERVDPRNFLLLNFKLKHQPHKLHVISHFPNSSLIRFASSFAPHTQCAPPLPWLHTDYAHASPSLCPHSGHPYVSWAACPRDTPYAGQINSTCILQAKCRAGQPALSSLVYGP